MNENLGETRPRRANSSFDACREEPKRIVIVGGGFAGIAAALQPLGLSPGASPSSSNFATDLAEAAVESDFAQGNGAERAHFKQKLYGQLDGLLPEEAIIASSPSGIPMSQVQPGAASHPERRVIGHPFNPLAEFSLLADVLEKLLAAAEQAVDRDTIAAKSGIACALALIGTMRDRVGGAEAPARGGLAPWQTRALKAYIETHLDQEIRLEDLTALTRLSPSYFSVAFRRSFGEPPYAYVIRRRMARAQVLMLSTDEPLSQIAVACGLSDQAHLSKLFRRTTNMSPSAWRRQRQRLACGAPIAC